jgi:hypothetical protein
MEAQEFQQSIQGTKVVLEALSGVKTVNEITQGLECIRPRWGWAD